MIKLSASAVRGFVEECYRKGFNEQQTAYLLERSLDTSDTLLYKRAEKKGDDDWEETTREEFFAKHPEAKEMYQTPKYRKDPRYASFIDAMDNVKGGEKIYSKKGNPYLFKWDIKKEEDNEKKASDDSENWEDVSREDFLKANPNASQIYHNNESRQNPQYAAFFRAMDGLGKIKRHKQTGKYIFR